MNLTKTQVENAKNLECDKCNSVVMTQVFIIKKISGLLMEDGKDTYMPVSLFACQKCGHINEIFTKELGISTESA
jgi:phage FluMu protein Com